MAVQDRAQRLPVRHRSSWRRGKVESPNNFEVLQEVVAGPDHAADELIRLQDVLEGMPENQRRAILLREWQGLTYKEISTELGLTQGAVETLIFRARRALAQGLEQDADTWKRRLRRGADVGGVFACVKALLGGGGAAAVKITATALAVATTAVAAATTEGPKHDAYHLSLGKQPAPDDDSRHARGSAEDSGADELDTRALHGDTNREVHELRRAKPPEACLAAPLASRRGDARAGTRHIPGADPHARSLHRPSRRLSCSRTIAAPARRRPTTARTRRTSARRWRQLSRPRRRLLRLPLPSPIRHRRPIRPPSPSRARAATRASPTSPISRTSPASRRKTNDYGRQPGRRRHKAGAKLSRLPT